MWHAILISVRAIGLQRKLGCPAPDFSIGQDQVEEVMLWRTGLPAAASHRTSICQHTAAAPSLTAELS